MELKGLYLNSKPGPGMEPALGSVVEGTVTWLISLSPFATSDLLGCLNGVGHFGPMSPCHLACH